MTLKLQSPVFDLQFIKLLYVNTFYFDNKFPHLTLITVVTFILIVRSLLGLLKLVWPSILIISSHHRIHKQLSLIIFITGISDYHHWVFWLSVSSLLDLKLFSRCLLQTSTSKALYSCLWGSNGMQIVMLLCGKKLCVWKYWMF